MTTSIRPRRVSHFNLIMEDYDATMAHLVDLFAADMILDLPKPEWHANLVDIGGVIFELFCPPNFLLHARCGPHFLGIEYEAGMTETRAAIAAHKVRIIRELGVAVHTDPADCLGMDLEFYEGSFYDNSPPVLARPMRTLSWWRDEHPLGLSGLKAYTVTVSDITAARDFIASFMAGEVVYDQPRPAIGARAIGLRVADCVIELLSPTGDGDVRRELERVGEGIWSAVFRVRDTSQARAYFTGRAIEMTAGSSPDRFAVARAANRGVMFEFEA